MAKERGLEPLSLWLWAQPRQGEPLTEAAKYINADKGVASAEEALQGAMDILAENIADDATIRAWVRKHTFDQALLRTDVKNAETESVYEMYYNYQEPVRKPPPHRVLAINRGGAGGCLCASHLT